MNCFDFMIAVGIYGTGMNPVNRPILSQPGGLQFYLSQRKPL